MIFMTAEIPRVEVFKKTTPRISRPGMAGKVALVGSFDTLETSPVNFIDYDEFVESFGDDATYNGCLCAKQVFKGASSVLCVNTTTESSGTRDKTVTVAKLTSALAKIKGEDWDILFVAEILSDTFLPVITQFLEDCFLIKFPAGYIGVLNGQTSAANVTSAGLAGDQCYGLLTQSATVNGEVLSLLETGAYYCGLIAGLNVGSSMTRKIVDGVTSVNPEFTFETGDAGKAYVEAGLTTLKCLERDNRYIVVNSEQPNGYDLYINRVRDFVVKEMGLHQFLGERTRPVTLDQIKQELYRVKRQCVNSLDLLEDIVYEVEKKNSHCVEVHIIKLLFAGILTKIDVFVSLEVE